MGLISRPAVISQANPPRAKPAEYPGRKSPPHTAKARYRAGSSRLVTSARYRSTRTADAEMKSRLLSSMLSIR